MNVLNERTPNSCGHARDLVDLRLADDDRVEDHVDEALRADGRCISRQHVDVRVARDDEGHERGHAAGDGVAALGRAVRRRTTGRRCRGADACRAGRAGRSARRRRSCGGRPPSRPGAARPRSTPSRIASPHSTTASGLTTRQSLTKRSASITSQRLFQDVAVGVGPAELEEAPEVAHVVARLRDRCRRRGSRPPCRPRGPCTLPLGSMKSAVPK